MIYNKPNCSYTWKEEYCLPFETEWGKIAKFCFLNGLSWSYVKNNRKLRKYVCKESSVNFHAEIPTFISDKVKNETLKICPQCMKYGYHSYLHEIEGFNHCFLHKCALVNILPEQLEASKYGTYEFAEIKTEHLIRNKELVMLIKRYANKQANENLIDVKYIFPSHGIWGRKTCYESTERIFQKLCLLQNEVDIYGCKCIGYIKAEHIDMENERLVKKYLINYTKFRLQYNIGIRLFDNFKQNYLYYQNCYWKNYDEPYQLTENILGWSFMAIMTDVIEKMFDGYEDWKQTVSEVNGHNQVFLTKDRAAKYAVVLAYQAVTATRTSENVICVHSRYWDRNTYAREFGLNVYEELGNYQAIYYQVGGRYERGKTTQYVIFPILKDLFECLAIQAYNLLMKQIIRLDTASIDTLKSDIWKVPQYVILYYSDRTEIYRCVPE